MHREFPFILTQYLGLLSSRLSADCAIRCYRLCSQDEMGTVLSGKVAGMTDYFASGVAEKGGRVSIPRDRLHAREDSCPLTVLFPTY
jgi:hypothetical protein